MTYNTEEPQQKYHLGRSVIDYLVFNLGTFNALLQRK